LKARLDTILHYQTPEGIELSLAAAGPAVRGLAYLIDLSIRAVFYLAVGITVSLMGGVGKAIMLIGLFLVEWFYPVLFEVYRGCTPGKKLLGLTVLHDDGTPVSWSASLLRNLLRTVDILPSFYLVGLITMVLHPQFKRLGDLAAGTVVIYAGKNDQMLVIPALPPAIPPAPLRLDEQRIILDFCERAGALSAARRHELAGYLTALAGEKSPETQLLAFGNWFLKGK